MDSVNRPRFDSILPDVQTPPPGVSESPPPAQAVVPKKDLIARIGKKINSFAAFLLRRRPTAATDKTLNSKEFHHIASGAAKAVYIVKHGATEEEERSVYYTAVKGNFEKIFGRKKAEIQEEVKTAASIKQALATVSKEGTESHIATDLQEIKGFGSLQGQYVVQAPKAGEKGKNINLDQLLQEQMPLEDRFDLGEQILTGIKNMHQTGHVHGDLKGENILHYKEPGLDGKEKSVLRVADFGKTRKMGANDSVLHTGNPRFAAPEGRSSQKAEVFSTALLLLRVLEEQVLQRENTDMIVGPDKVKADQSGENLRGITKFVVTNDKCTQTQSKNIQGKIRLLGGFAQAIINKRGEREEASSGEVNTYIDALFSKLKEGQTSEQVRGLNAMQSLLHSMVNQDPSKRPDMELALSQYQTARQTYLGGIL